MCELCSNDITNGCSQRAFSKSITNGCSQRAFSKSITNGCSQRVLPMVVLKESCLKPLFEKAYQKPHKNSQKWSYFQNLKNRVKIRVLNTIHSKTVTFYTEKKGRFFCLFFSV